MDKPHSMQDAIILERIDSLKDLVDQRFTWQKDLLDERFENQDTLIKNLHVKADHTNGRLGRLERWRAYILGAIGILTALVLPVALAIIYSYINKA